ncbi:MULTISPECIES: flagellar hook-associated protein FlgK [Bacillus]|uniref:Flagellar hook-associated protein 1 n=1 Tax=Bacillus toyonensis TaxID=155322 RepID=A0A2B6QNG5_9BACI|nr:MULTISPECIES: flagellar hook-associated protein FlgK [Bacillus]AFU12306.1 Flagellar hook-associated protein FlgK [Bacillus thuringiensis MC28]EEL23751.1 Flagellar hook-associated protein FlgK [Bacillus cereus Rock1-3]EEL35153.1 Flagellar hook-associated protein FlgK [Bacillus cereus Rock3-28]EEL41089.1 Flagellar hook-associated protein FlgK [Bacillus cereus Rock3-29]EOP27734.1 flagellar hook-associated protein FlgK [Bacillus cereus VD131]KAB0448563.1 flagellar hook-associated protein FlgK 
MRLSDYNTPLSGMLAAQMGLQTTKQNLSNIHTPGYVRQMVNYGSVGASNGHTPEQRIGYGVQTLGVDRITDEVKTKQFNDQLSQLSYYNYMNSTLSRVESMVGTTGKNSLSSLMDGFFNAFREVAKNPEQPNYYDTLISETGKFTSQVNRLAKNLDTVEAQTTEDIEAHVNEFNRLAASLAEANKKIGQAGTQVPNQLLDERDRIVTEMSKYANIEVSYESMNPNIASVRMNGVLTVSGQDTYPLQLNKEKDPMSVEIYGSEISVTSGAIKSAIDTKAKIVEYKKNLEGLMSSVKNQVNTVMGKDFFVGDYAKDMKLNPEFAKDISKMKISAETANKLAAITDGDYKEGLSNKQALDQFIVGVASDKSAVNAYQKIHGDLLEGIQQEKMSVEGVNMEEEMVNLMAFQKYFVANSKAITTMNEVFDSLFSIIR